jgi:hypothetical protein
MPKTHPTWTILAYSSPRRASRSGRTAPLPIPKVDVTEDATMQIAAANGLATLTRIGTALAATHDQPDAHRALMVAFRVQDRMLGDLLEAVDRPWLDTAFERRERIRRREAHEALLVDLAV